MQVSSDIIAPAPTESGRPFRPADFDTFAAALDYAASGACGFTFYTARGEVAETLGYARLREEAGAVAARLRAVGLRPGDRVAVLAETNGDFARVFCGAMLAGCCPAPLPLPVAFGARDVYSAQIRRIVRACGARAVFAPAELSAWVDEAMAEVDLLFCGRLDALPGAEARPFEDEAPAPGPGDLAYLQFSSGTTGAPKGVAVTHGAMMANLSAIARHGLKLTGEDRGVSWLPLYHDMGLVGCFLAPVAAQFSADLFATKDFVRRPLLWLDLFSRNRATLTYAPSFGYDLATRRARGTAPAGMDLSSWRVAGIGGDMIKAPTLRAFARTFGPAGFSAAAFTPSYGMAETTLALSFAPLGQGLRTERLDLGALEREMIARPPRDAAEGAEGPEEAPAARDFTYCGPALPGHGVEIRGPDGAVLPEGAVGAIHVTGPSLMRGYFKDAAASAAVLKDGWLDTGDLGFLRDGQIVVTGRAKDLMIVNGRNLWPQDLEWTAEQAVDHVREGGVAAFSVTPDDSGARIDEAVIMVAECRLRAPEDRTAFAASLRASAREAHGVDVEIALAPNGGLPRTSSGKLSRVRARRLYLDGAFEPAGAR